jgi:integrase
VEDFMSTPFCYSFPFTFKHRLEEPISILKRRHGTYYAQIGPKYYRASLDTRSERIAKARAEELRKAARILAVQAMLPQSSPPPPSRQTRTPLAEALQEYVLHCKATKAKSTVNSDVFYLRDSFGEVCDALKKVPRKKVEKTDRPEVRRRRKLRRARAGKRVENHIEAECVEDLTTAAVSRLISARVQTRGLEPKSANRYRDSILTFVNWAIEFREVRFPDAKNPVEAVKKYKMGDPEIVFLTLQQIREQLDALAGNVELQTMAAVYIYAGLRRSEALWLTAADVDLTAGKNGAILIRAKTIQGESWKPKNGKHRIVPINRKLRPYLEAYRRRPSPGNWFFPSPEGTRWDPDNFSQKLREVNKAKELSWSCWEFRHTFGSHLAMRGESLYKISELMGNSPEVCRKHYAALTPQSLEGASEFPEDPKENQPQVTAREHLRLLDKAAASGE